MPRRPTAPNPSSPTTPSFEAEVRANLLGQSLADVPGLGTVADLDLPHEFLNRLCDRVLRASFYERFRAVVGTESFSRPTSKDLASTDVPPALASFRPGDADSRTPPELILESETDPALHAARARARRHLSRDGLMAATARVISVLGADRVHTSAEPARLLTSAGVPCDLFAYIQTAETTTNPSPDEVIRSLAQRLAGGESLERIVQSLRRTKFRPQSSLSRFRPTSDSGHDAIHMLRAHATRATHYQAEGDGGNLDLLIGVLESLPTIPATVIVAQEHAEALRLTMANIPRPAAVHVISQPVSVSQWAADNAKPGMSEGKPAHLIPRFASRGEYRSTFVAGDDSASAAAGMLTARSPLLFQGGNMLVVDDLPQRRRVLLVGEAEIERNRTLGLSAEQTLEFFKVEMGVDLCEKLPAASYHIDQELTVRSTAAATHAFVPDVLAAATLIVDVCLAAITATGRWPAARIEAAGAHLRAGALDEALTQIWSCLQGERTPELGFPIALAEILSAGPADSGVGNLQRFLLALDHLAAVVIPAARCPDPNLAALLGSFQRRETDRAKIRTTLTRLGWKVHAIPAIPEESRGVNPLNGIHVPGAYLMPSSLGLLTPVDEAAKNSFAAVLGPSVQILTVSSAESQRRQGAVHCSVAEYGQ